MTRKDFELIARTIKGFDFPDSEQQYGYQIQESFAESMADSLSSTNPAFNKARFIAECLKD